MSRTQPLSDLQQVDLEAEAASRRTRDITAQLGESADLKRARRMAAEAESHLKTCRAKMRDLDLEVTSLNQKIEADEGRLYSGRAGNPKELASLEGEVASLKRWREKKEEDLLQAMFETEEAEGALADAQSILAQVTETWGADQVALAEEQARLGERLADLREKRDALAAIIGPGDIATYESLRQRKGGRAVAAVRNGLCEGCRMNPPSSQVQHARTGTDLVFCNNCGRILHVVA